MIVTISKSGPSKLSCCDNDLHFLWRPKHNKGHFYTGTIRMVEAVIIRRMNAGSLLVADRNTLVDYLICNLKLL